MTLTPCDSSMIEGHGYDPDSQAFHVKFRKTGKVWKYSPVSESLHADIVGADSIGKAFHDLIVRNAVLDAVLGEEVG